MIAPILSFNDITKLVGLSYKNQHLELIDAIIEMQQRYSFESLNPVLKALFYANIGIKEKKTLNKWRHLMSSFKEYGFYSYTHSRCYSSLNAADHHEVQKQENLVEASISYSSFCEIKANNLKTIPHIIHNVWVLSSTMQNINLQVDNFNKYNKYLKHNYDHTSGWDHYVWLTHPQAITAALQNRIIEDNYTIKYISELADTPQSAFLVSAALTFAELGYYAATSDFIRLMVLNKYGGVYTDGDYQVYCNLNKLVDNFDSITGSCWPSKMCTAFIAMTPQHLLTKMSLDLVARNFNFTDAPDYIKYPCTKANKIIADRALATSLFHLEKGSAALDKQINLVLPPGIFSAYDPITHKILQDYNADTYKSYGENCRNSFMETEVGIIGKDDFQGSWRNDQQEVLGYS